MVLEVINTFKRNEFKCDLQDTEDDEWLCVAWEQKKKDKDKDKLKERKKDK